MNTTTPRNNLVEINQAYTTIFESIHLKKNIILCVSASIAAYKAIEIASSLKKLGARVGVVMSEEAKKFITPLSFEGITHIRVLHKDSEDWTQPQQKQELCQFQSHTKTDTPTMCNHIAYAQWADICILAPASANTLAKLAYGIADTLIVQTLLATKAPILLAPAMNTQMLLATQTKQNIAMLTHLGMHIITPREALLACDTKGYGALAETQEILYEILRVGYSDPFWQEKEVCITGGGASAAIDNVRAITNHSSGLQASTLAIALYTLGARVTLISSAFPIPLPRSIKTIQVQSNEEYEQALLDLAESKLNAHTKTHQKTKPHLSKHKISTKKDDRILLFMAAALVDFAPLTPKQYKIKKSTTTTESKNATKTDPILLELHTKKDVLASLDNNVFIKIGFKAEDNGQNAIQNAKNMLLPSAKGGKGCSIVCLNVIESNQYTLKHTKHKKRTTTTPHTPFGNLQNKFVLLDTTSLKNPQNKLILPPNSKLALSYEIADFVKSRAFIWEKTSPREPNTPHQKQSTTNATKTQPDR